ncbi:hypothetical protein Tco_1025321 [Tanacetum coccineum]
MDGWFSHLFADYCGVDHGRTIIDLWKRSWGRQTNSGHVGQYDNVMLEQNSVGCSDCNKGLVSLTESLHRVIESFKSFIRNRNYRIIATGFRHIGRPRLNRMEVNSKLLLWKGRMQWVLDCMERIGKDDAVEILGVHSLGDCGLGNVTTDDNEDD